MYLAGAFGSYLNIDSALCIGLLPEMPKARFIRAGNAAAASLPWEIGRNDDQDQNITPEKEIGISRLVKSRFPL
ncbi:MAG: ASKHA domain-containing protein [Pseudomonadota bacterium]